MPVALVRERGRASGDADDLPLALQQFARHRRANAGARPGDQGQPIARHLPYSMAAEARLHVRTYLFTDIEGSTRMWEETPERMQPALARHDAIARSTVERHRGVVVKKTGDGLHAVFADPLDAVRATLDMQLALADPQATAGVPLLIRCGLHAGADQPREGDFYGTAVNRAARIMSTAHGGQVLLSQAVASLVGDRLPREVDLIDLGAVRLRDL